MDMRAKLVFEKFTEKSDPIKDMGIGWDFEILSAEFGEFDLDELGLDLPEKDLEEPYVPSETKEIDTDIAFDHKCPKCGFEFNES